MMTSIITTILSVLGGIIVALITSKRTESIGARDKEVAVSTIIHKSSEVIYLLSDVLNTVEASRVVLLRVENGSLSDMSTNKFVTVVAESYKPPMSTSRPLFQKYDIDSSYKNLVTKLKDDGPVLLYAPDMEEGFLKNYYLATGVVYSYNFPIHRIGDTVMWFGSISFTSEEWKADPVFHLMVSRMKHEISTILNFVPEVGGYAVSN